MSISQQKGQRINHWEPLSALHLLSPLLVVSANVDCEPGSMPFSTTESGAAARDEVCPLFLPAPGHGLQQVYVRAHRSERREALCV